jgi:hypothetical protein
MTISGLTDYLILLSIFQTCRYKNISFLRFLLSKKRDLDVFPAPKSKRRRYGLELYPKGYTPPHLAYLPKQAMYHGAVS